jgi:MFS family permease
MISIVLASLIASMDTTIVNTTMPIISKELGGISLYAWSFAAYMITSTVLSSIAGRLSDLFGRKKVYACGIALFLAGSLMCGTSSSMLQLVLYRAFQGIGAGFMMPFPSIIAGDLFSVAQRGKIQAFFTGMWGISAIMILFFLYERRHPSPIRAAHLITKSTCGGNDCKYVGPDRGLLRPSGFIPLMYLESSIQLSEKNNRCFNGPAER